MSDQASSAGDSCEAMGYTRAPARSAPSRDALLTGPAVERVREQWSETPRYALILGTGLGDLAEQVEAEAVIPYQEIPGFPHSTALSHKSRLVCGRMHGVPVVTMQGRCHLYEGYSVERLAFPVRVMRALGADTLIVSNASGGVNPQYTPGDIMVMQDHINLMWTAPRCCSGAADGEQALSHPSRSRVPAAYDPSLIAAALSVARHENFVAHQGVYVGVTGPTYETRAEYRLFRRIGGDVVGMSTVPEVTAAVAGRMRVLGLSLVTNVAKPDSPEVVDAHDVVEVAAAAAAHMQKIVTAVIRQG